MPIAKCVNFLNIYLKGFWFVLLKVKLGFIGNTNTLAAVSAWPQPVWTVELVVTFLRPVFWVTTRGRHIHLSVSVCGTKSRRRKYLTSCCVTVVSNIPQFNEHPWVKRAAHSTEKVYDPNWNQHKHSSSVGRQTAMGNSQELCGLT